MVGLKPRMSGVRSGTYCQLHHQHLPFHRKLGKHIKSLPSFFLAVSSIMSLGKKRPRNWSLNLEFGLSWFGAKKRLELSPPNLPSILIRANFFADIFFASVAFSIKNCHRLLFYFCKDLFYLLLQIFLFFAQLCQSNFLQVIKSFLTTENIFTGFFCRKLNETFNRKN